MRKLFDLLAKIFNNDYLFSVIAKVMNLVIAIVVSAITSRFFGAELKGVMSVVQNDVTLYAVFLGLGIYQAYPFFRKKEPEIFSSYVNNITSFYIVFQIIAVLIATTMFFYKINTYFALAIILMPIETYIKQLNYVVLIEHSKRRNSSSLIISLSEIVILGIMMVIFEASPTTVLAYYVCTVIVNLMVSYINIGYSPLKIRFSLNRIFEFIKFGYIPMLVYLCMSINYKLDIQMLKWYENVSYSDIGIYGTGVSLASKVWLIPDAVKDILLSRLVKGKHENEVAKVIRCSFAVCAASILIFLLIGKTIVFWLYGEEFSNVYYVMAILFVGVLSMIFYKMVYSYNISRGKRTINLIFLGVAAIVNIIGNLIFIPLYGIWGAASMSVVSYVVCGFSFLFYFRRISRIPLFKILIVQKEDFDMVKKFFKKKQ